MILLNEQDIIKLGTNWRENIESLESATNCLKSNEFCQPIKPYLSFPDPKNRIIAMPAYLGQGFNIAGLKWIASFPDNIKDNKPRAHSTTILNSATTGEPIAIINTPLISVIRTASVSALMIKYFLKHRKKSGIKVGLVGLGPIGKYHTQMLIDKFDDYIDEIKTFDLNQDKAIEVSNLNNPKVSFSDDLKKTFEESDIFITCTVSSEPYIDQEPKGGSLHLNVSLRDYKPAMYKYFDQSTVVDNWDEVCRKNTDIENMHKQFNLQEEDTQSIIDVVCENGLSKIDDKLPVFFNPMGMAVYDIAIAHSYLQRYLKRIQQD